MAIGQLIAGEVVEKFDDTTYLGKLLKNTAMGKRPFLITVKKNNDIRKLLTFLIFDVTPSNETVGLTNLEYGWNVISDRSLIILISNNNVQVE